MVDIDDFQIISNHTLYEMQCELTEMKKENEQLKKELWDLQHSSKNPEFNLIVKQPDNGHIELIKRIQELEDKNIQTRRENNEKALELEDVIMRLNMRVSELALKISNMAYKKYEAESEEFESEELIRKQKLKERDEFLNWTLHDIMDCGGISWRSYNALKAAGFENVKQLLALTESELLNIPRWGRKSLNALKKLVESNHHKLRIFTDDPMPWDAKQ